MMRRFVGLACLLVLTATCNRDSSPTNPTPQPTPGTTPSPTLTFLEIRGGPSVPPGESVQFTAVATLSDRSTRDVTAEAAWRVSNPAMFSVAAGLVSATTVGEGFLTAVYQNRNAGLSIVSIPSGTGILVGAVKEASFPVSGARVEVVGGSFAGRSTATDATGFYRLYGVAGDLQIRVSAADYVSQTTRVNVEPLATPRRDQILNFNLTPSGRQLTLAGNYRATLTASSTCGATFPADAAVRNYLATVNQDGSGLSVVLSGAEFGTITRGVAGNRFDGRARPDAVELTVGSMTYSFYYGSYLTWGIVERIIPPPSGPWGFVTTMYLAVVGTATGPATPATISTVLNGMLSVYDAPAGFNTGAMRHVSSCIARDHQLVLTR